MKLLLIMEGKDRLQESSYAVVLNYKSKIPFMYYKT